jgi:hypothetical protein
MTARERNVTGKNLKLTKRTVDAAAPSGSRYVLWDDEVRGFGLRVEPSGTKTYLVRYRWGGALSATSPDGDGRHVVLTPEEARREARIQLAKVAQGNDPAAERSAKRKELTVAQLVERYVAEHLQAHNKPVQRCAPCRRRKKSTSVARRQNRGERDGGVRSTRGDRHRPPYRLPRMILI